jgi:hypothetical protein
MAVRNVACKGKGHIEQQGLLQNLKSFALSLDHRSKWAGQEISMRYRSLLGIASLACALVSFTSCNTSPSLTSIVVTPTSMSLGGPGLTGQLIATGYYTHPDHPAITRNITNEAAWQSSATQCVTVTQTGFITSGADTCTNILVTASAPGYNGLISGSMTVSTGETSSGDVRPR